MSIDKNNKNSKIAENQYEHFFSATDKGPIGIKGSHTQTAIKENDIVRVGGLCFDIDCTHFTTEFTGRIGHYLTAVVPGLELRQTSIAGNLHGVLRFQNAVKVDIAKRIWTILRKLLLADPQAGFLAKARIVGSRKIKPNGDTFVVKSVRKGSRVSAQQILSDLTEIPTDKNGDQAGAIGWKRKQFAGLMECLVAPNGQSLWDGIASHGICPIHGTGSNPKQCVMHADFASCACFGDCGDGTGQPKPIKLVEIVEKRAIAPASWTAFQPYYAEPSKNVGGRPVVEHNQFKPTWEFYSAILTNLTATGRFYQYGTVISEVHEGRIVPVPNPAAFVGAVNATMEIAAKTNGQRIYKRFAKEDAAAIIYMRPLLDRLPYIDLFTEIPVYDSNLNLCQSGYNKDAKIYCSGEPIPPSSDLTALMKFLDVISWRDIASRDNYVGVLLTNLFPSLFYGQKPVISLNANRQQVGKSILARCVAKVTTAEPITTLSYNANDEEFEKMLASRVMKSNYVIIDNAKTSNSRVVSSPVLERSVTDDRLCFRQLGFNRTIERPNGVMWMLTMNTTRLSPDLVDRALPINLHYEGNPAERISPIGPPEDFFDEHRQGILASLLGLVEKWISAGCPSATHTFRFRKWASLIGGILAANHFDQFLVNVDESRVELDPVLAVLQNLAEKWPNQFKKASEWLAELKQEEQLPEIWVGKAQHGQVTRLGHLFKSYKGQPFNITHLDGRQQVARLTSRNAHSGAEWGFVTDGGRGGPNSRGDDNGEPGEPENGGSPTGSPPQVRHIQEVTSVGEPGEPKSDPVISKQTITTGSPQGRYCGFDADREKGSPGSPITSESSVTPCQNNKLGLKSLPVNLGEPLIEVLPNDTVPALSGSDVPETTSSAPDRITALYHLRECVPNPAPTKSRTSKTNRPVESRTIQIDDEDLEFQVGWDGRPFDVGILAIDTETTLIQGRESITDLVLAAASDGERHVILPADQLADFFVVHRGHTLVFHNIAFDFWVLEQLFASIGREDALETLWGMARENRLRDSMLLDQLVTLARTGAKPVPRNLEEVAGEFAGITLDKTDPYRMRYSELKGQPLNDVDPGFLDYAIKDPFATIHAYAALAAAAEEIMGRHTDLYDAILAARYGLLSEVIQVQGAIALAAVSRNGMHVDLDRLKKTRRELECRRDELIIDVENAIPDKLEHAAGDSGLFRRDDDGHVLITDSGSPRTSSKRLDEVLRIVLHAINKKHEGKIEIPVLTKSGQLSQKIEDWLPLREKHTFVKNWLDLKALSKIIQFTQNHATERIHPNYQLLVRTGRTSCSGPNLQQLPRDGGIRECFIPSPGHVLMAIDYSYIELRTLAAVCEFRFGSSRLADVIRRGIDPHINTAAIIRGEIYEDFSAIQISDPGAFKTDRQRAKAINFGVPGGLGAEALLAYAKNTFGVEMTLEESTDLRNKLIHEVYPELQEYLADNLMRSLARGLGVHEETCWNAFDERDERPDWLAKYIKNVVSGRTHRADGEPYKEQYLDSTWDTLRQINTHPDLSSALNDQQGSQELAARLFGRNAVATLTGRIRSDASFTQARNTPFQGLAADGAKRALFQLIAAGYRVVAFIHDEVLIELPIDADHTADAKRIDQIMCSGMEEITGKVPIACGDPTLMERWAKDAKTVYDDQSRLLVWQPETGGNPCE